MPRSASSHRLVRSILVAGIGSSLSALAMPVALPIPSALAAPGDENWSDAFAIRGTNGLVKSLARYGEDLVVGGTFQFAGASAASWIASWDGADWHPLGGGISQGGAAAGADDLEVYGGRLVACGEFQVPHPYLAQWDGVSWAPVGGVAVGKPTAMTIFENDLVIAGTVTGVGGVTVRGAARWNGSAWTAMGELLNERVDDLIVKDGTLYACGSLLDDGGQRHLVARWTGSTWVTMGLAAPGATARALVDYQGRLVVGGEFTAIDGVPAANIAAWNGSSWSPLGAGVVAGPLLGGVWSLGVLDADLVVAGVFDEAGGSPAGNVARWDGVSWHAFGAGTPADAYCFALLVEGPALTLGGYFFSIDGAGAACVARWTGTEWQGIGQGNGTFGGVFALVSHGADLVAGGGFRSAGDVEANRIARWDGAAWHAMGEGFDDVVYALESSGGELHAGGAFTTADGIPAGRVARWDGSGWRSLGAGPGIVDGRVWAMTRFEGDLVIGGEFATVDGLPVGHIARWDGAAWHSLGQGMSDAVYALTVHDGELIAGGSFMTAGGVLVGHLGRWNGRDWSEVGAWVLSIHEIPVRTVVSFNGDLYIGGQFEQIGDRNIINVGRWDGQEWWALEDGLDFRVRALSAHDGLLVAGGWFDLAGSLLVNKIAAWNGQSWSTLGSGAGTLPGFCCAEVLALTSHDGSLYAGGAFTLMGGKPSYQIARWTQLVDVPGSGPLDGGPEAATRFGVQVPSPARVDSRIEIRLDRTERVELGVFGVDGRLHGRWSGVLPAGRHRVSLLDVLDVGGDGPADGVYFLRSAAGDAARTVRLVVIGE